jgi:hypothetical protein
MQPATGGGSRWRPQFGLRSLLIALFVISVIVGVIAKPTMEFRQRREIAKHLASAGFSLHYDHGEIRSGGPAWATPDGSYPWQQVDFGHHLVMIASDRPAKHTRQTMEMIAELPYLRTVHVTFDPDTNAFSLPSLRNLGEIQDLKLDNRVLQPGDIDQIVQCPTLVTLDIEVDEESALELAALDALSNLQVLHIKGPVSDENLAAWQHLTRLDGLSLYSAGRLSGPRLADFIRRNPNLEQVNLNYADCTVDVCEALAECRALSHVALKGSKISDEGLVQLRRLPKLIHLDISGPQSQVRGTAFKGAGSFPALRYVTASESQIDDEGVLHLSKLPKLEGLDLCRTKITDAACEHLAQREWDSLFLAYTGVTDHGVNLLKGEHLNLLDATGTEVSPQPFLIPSRWPSLGALYLGKRPQSELEVQQVLRLPNLERLIVDGPVSSETMLRYGKRLIVVPAVKQPRGASSSEASSKP